ncbi:MAG: T9SS type A sorting domain-containing protein, partial [Candidatus Marinimicrobia bacterium]|nr:T9SS type A sorting domain-containing protein [Candidatus Neomarinimicrobiota bacterium]
MSNAAKSTLTGTWIIMAKDGTDSTLASNGPFTLTFDGSTLANDPDDLLPVEFALRQNYPNPFNPNTTLRFETPRQGRVELIVYDLRGREVVRLLDRHMPPGYFDVIWNGKTAAGAPIASGMYFARMVTPDYSRTIKMILLK